MRYGDQIRVAHGVSTAWAAWDFETYSAAGYVWDSEENKWGSLPGHSNQSRGLKAVGARNYIEHESFEVLCLAYDLLDDQGLRLWTPTRAAHPIDLLAHIAAGKILSSWNNEFEFSVYNVHCVPKYGWPPLSLEQCRCDMSKAAANSYPRGLANFGNAVNLTYQKDPEGDRLVRKLTVPKNPTKKAPGLRWVP
jgi:hypothetical protein